MRSWAGTLPTQDFVRVFALAKNISCLQKKRSRQFRIGLSLRNACFIAARCPKGVAMRHLTGLVFMVHPAPQGLYDPRNEHDACGVGFVAHIKGERSHGIVKQALEILSNLDHRGAVGADPLLGDGAGILLQIPDPLIRKWAQDQRSRSARARRIRSRHVLPAAGRGGPRLRDRAAGTVHREGRPARHRLARCARSLWTVLARRWSNSMPVMRQCIIAAGRKLRRRSRVRAQAGRDPQADAQSAGEAG